MSREHLATASDLLESAAETATDGDAAERLADLADQLDTLATRERDPDHGRLARIENALEEVKDAAGEDAAATVEEAHEHVIEFRKTIEGV